MIFPSVVFPQPDSPTIAIISPSGYVSYSEKFETASATSFLILSTSISEIVLAASSEKIETVSATSLLILLTSISDIVLFQQPCFLNRRIVPY